MVFHQYLRLVTQRSRRDTSVLTGPNVFREIRSFDEPFVAMWTSEWFLAIVCPLIVSEVLDHSSRY